MPGSNAGDDETAVGALQWVETRANFIPGCCISSCALLRFLDHARPTFMAVGQSLESDLWITPIELFLLRDFPGAGR